MTKKIKTVIVVAVLAILAMSVWQFVRNNRLDEEIKALEVQRTLKQKEIDDLQAKLTVSDTALENTKNELNTKAEDLHKQNSDLMNNISDVVKQKDALSGTIDQLKKQIASMPETPPEVVQECCPELPVIKQLNAQLEAKIGAQAIEISLKDSLIVNKDKEIKLFKSLFESYEVAYADQKNLVNSLRDRVNLDDRELEAYKKKDSFKWLPKFSVGVGIACDVVGGRGCVAGPSFQLGWRF